MKAKFSQKMLSAFLCIALIMAYLPISISAAPKAIMTNPAIADPGTADSWEDIMGTVADGNRYAGRVWVDKSVYTDGQTVLLNRDGAANSQFVVDVDQSKGEYFQVVFSALGSSMSTNTQTYASRPIDVVLVLDTSTSMDDVSTNKLTRFENMIIAANKLLEELLALGDVRVAVVSFNRDSETILELKNYTNGIVLSVNSYTNKNGGGVITASDKNGKKLGNDSGYTSGTNLQDGIDRGMDILAGATNTEGRAPIAIVLADGRANRAVNDDWYDPVSSNVTSSGEAGIMLSTLLNAAYGKTRVEKNYNTDMTVYGIGVDLSNSSDDYIFLNPGATGSAGFNGNNTDSAVRTAWNAFTRWRSGTTATIGSGRSTFTFDHRWPASLGITTAEIAANINYVDNYQNVSGANLGEAFNEILQEISTNAFNPITSSKVGATGVEDTPLIYVDNIGKYMEVKSVQALQVFGHTFNIVKNNDGTYSIAQGSGVNPTTNEAWSTGDVDVQLRYNADGTQQLRIYIDQEILPILLDKITVTTENGNTTTTLDEYKQVPLRIFYTVGVDSSILLPNGEVNPEKIADDYEFLNNNGTADFYSNAFGVLNRVDTDGNGLLDKGDSHVGFIPSHNNRYYYHQAHQEVYIAATTANGQAINWGNGYAVEYNESDFRLTKMTYEDLAGMSDSSDVYTKIVFVRPIGKGNEAEEVTYLIHSTWDTLKGSATFHDTVNDVYLNDGAAIDPATVDTFVSNYKKETGIRDNQLEAVLGLGSRRVSRLNHMFEVKAENTTGTAEYSYAPTYSDQAAEEDDMHEHSEVIVWLGNNGKLTLPLASGIKVTKDVTELAEGASADEAFEIRVLLKDMAYTASNIAKVFVADVHGDALDSSKYSIAENGGDILVKVYLADNESAVIMGAPNGTVFEVTEAANSQYSYTYTGATQTVAGKIVEGVVTNAPILPGSLYITKEVVHAYGGNAFPNNHEFDFKVTFTDALGNPIAGKTFSLENNYDANLTALTTDANGVMTGKLRHGETIHIKNIPAGAKVAVEEINIPTNYTSTVYRSRNHSGATADNDGIVTIESGRNATVVVTNTYTPATVGVDITLNGTKNFDATEMDSDSEFTFKLQEYTNGRWSDVEGKTVTIVKGENASKPFAFTPLNLEFSKPGVHSYQIIEAKGNNTDITYDRSVYTFTVDVVIDNNGDLKAEVVGHTVPVSNDGEGAYTVHTIFTNYYHKTTASIAVKKDVDDKAGVGKTSADFIIETYKATVDGNDNWTIGELIRTTVTDAQGEALLVRHFDNTDFEGVVGNTVSYHFIIKEKNDGRPGWIYDTTEYRVTVILTKDALTSDISAELEVIKVTDRGEYYLNGAGDSATIRFKNTYDPTDAELPLDALVKKTLTGRNLLAGEFEFAIRKNGENEALATGRNDANGNVIFTPNVLTFSKVGKYEFDVVEIKGTKGGVAYDPIVYDLVAEVSDNNGKLEINYYFEDAVGKTVTFKNTYTVKPAEVVINGVKTLKVVSGNRTMRPGEFTFVLYNEAGAEVGRTTNLANGTFRFDAIAYDVDDIGKTYTYTVKELAPDGTTDGTYENGGISWSGRSFDVTVTITDNGDGTITADVTNNGSDSIAFENVYESKPVNVVLNGKKNLENRPLTAGEFTFTLFRTDRSYGNPAVVASDITHNADGEFLVDLGTLSEGNHYFLVKENLPAVQAKGIHYSAAEYRISIEVTDPGNGAMIYSKTVVNPAIPAVADAAIEFTNVYSPEAGELPLSGNKTYNGGKVLEDDIFSVGLYDDEGNLLQTAPIKADGSFVFDNLVYHAASVNQTFIYTVKEMLPDGATDNGNGTFTLGNIIYDGSSFTLEVTVTDDDKDGALEIVSALKKDGATVNELAFVNVFVPDAITYDIEAKKTYNKGLSGNDFDFTLVSADGKTNVNQTKKNDANGRVQFDAITFTEAGVYRFTVKEINKLFGFISYSVAEYEVTLTVVNENGVLRVSDVQIENIGNSNETDLEFINVYVMDGEDEITLRGNKTLTGDRTQVNADEFAFGLYDESGALIETVRNDANGNFAFSTLTFDETDVPVNGQKQITYTVKEIAGNNARYTYDSTVYTVVVTVKDNDRGGIAVSYTVNGVDSADADISFTNTYTNPAPVTYTPIARKLYNKALAGGEFTFKLEGEINGVAVSQEKTNAEGGAITFDTLRFPEAGTYTFKVSEINKLLGFIQYSTAEYTLVVTVVDTNGVLSLGSATVNDDPNGTISFTNVYVMDGEDEITLRGNKTLTGDRTQVNADEFAFGLYDESGALIETVRNDADGNFAFSTLTFDETDVPVNGQKQITYTVKEIKGSDIRVTYDETVYTVVITVMDNGEGGITASYTVDNNENGTIAFTNVYTPKPEDITVDFDIVKTVVNKGSEAIGPEGFEFLLNAMADGVADITVKSDENGKAKFVLSFTEDDIGKTYTYTLTEVNGGKANVTYSDAAYTVTVTISLNENNELVAGLTVNGETADAVVAAFENTYDYTPVPKTENPKTGEMTNYHLWLALLLVSGGVCGAALCGKKRKTNG